MPDDRVAVDPLHGHGAAFDSAEVVLAEAVCLKQLGEVVLRVAAQDPRRLDPPLELFLRQHGPGVTGSSLRGAPNPFTPSKSFQLDLTSVHVASKLRERCPSDLQRVESISTGFDLA